MKRINWIITIIAFFIISLTLVSATGLVDVFQIKPYQELKTEQLTDTICVQNTDKGQTFNVNDLTMQQIVELKQTYDQDKTKTKNELKCYDYTKEIITKNDIVQSISINMKVVTENKAKAVELTKADPIKEVPIDEELIKG